MAGEASKAHSSDPRRIFSTSTFYSLMTTARFSWYGTVSFIKHEESSWIVPCAGFEVVGLKLISFLTPVLFKVGGRGLGSVSPCAAVFPAPLFMKVSSSFTLGDVLKSRVAVTAWACYFWLSCIIGLCVAVVILSIETSEKVMFTQLSKPEGLQVPFVLSLYISGLICKLNNCVLTGQNSCFGC